MKKAFPDLPQWAFEIDEVSAGVYEVIGRDVVGHGASAEGTDLEELISRCRAEAKRLSDEKA